MLRWGTMQNQKINETRPTPFGLSSWRHEMVITENLLTGSAVETCLDDLASLRLQQRLQS